MKIFKMELVGTEPVIIKHLEEEKNVRSEIIKNFDQSIARVAEQKGYNGNMNWQIEMTAKVVSITDRIERRMGKKKYENWKILITMNYDENKINQKEIIKMIEEAMNTNRGGS